ncbi:hypothetical protein AB0758_33925, partial [Tolypothrix bouteillei VB521301_2]|uniref:hypothetical protein n=1 Tax=Tolypothrix bouteillei TaxID=1246981 RepID=UPI0038B5B692
GVAVNWGQVGRLLGCHFSHALVRRYLNFHFSKHQRASPTTSCLSAGVVVEVRISQVVRVPQAVL